jgi:hypothetical protein
MKTEEEKIKCKWCNWEIDSRKKDWKLKYQKHLAYKHDPFLQNILKEKSVVAKIWATIWEIFGIFYLCAFVLTLLYNSEMFYKFLSIAIGVFCMSMKLYYEAKL